MLKILVMLALVPFALVGLALAVGIVVATCRAILTLWRSSKAFQLVGYLTLLTVFFALAK